MNYDLKVQKLENTLKQIGIEPILLLLQDEICDWAKKEPMICTKSRQIKNVITNVSKITTILLLLIAANWKLM